MFEERHQRERRMERVNAPACHTPTTTICWQSIFQKIKYASRQESTAVVSPQVRRTYVLLVISQHKANAQHYQLLSSPGYLSL